MPAGVRHGYAIWEGIRSIERCTYTCSHGITPGTAIMEVHPQLEQIPVRGNLTITDDFGTITLRNCKIDKMLSRKGSDGEIWILYILDRRWLWQEKGMVPGCYNQIDPHGKLIPRTIRSPIEMAEQCLDAMGEIGYEIDLPPALSRADGFGIPGYLLQGDNFAPSGTNPPVNWNYDVPAQALARLAEQFGRRVVFQPIKDRVLIAIPGRGEGLPSGSIASTSPTIDLPEIPRGVGVIGSPTRFQVRLKLEAVGREWDGSYKPINQLSYAPRSGDNKKIQLTPSFATLSADALLTFRITVLKANGIAVNERHDVVVQGNSAETKSVISERFLNGPNEDGTECFNNNPSSSPTTYLTAYIGGASTIFIEGLNPSVDFTVNVTTSATDTYTWEVTQEGGNEIVDWTRSPPGSFTDVISTPRLTREQARQLAVQTVYKCYRVVDQDVSGVGPINVPGYGELESRHQLVLLNSRVEQIVPEEKDFLAVDKRKGNDQPLVINFYEGYSKDKPAACYGAVATALSRIFWPKNQTSLNTDPTKEVSIGFSIDPTYQIVTFSDHAWTAGRVTKPVGGTTITTTNPEKYYPADLVLECAVNVRDKDTNQLACMVKTLDLPNGNPDADYHYENKPDCELNVIGVYDEDHKLLRVDQLEIDPFARANFYLKGMAIQFPTAAALTNDYNGIEPIDLDGAINQVSWSVGSGGSSTTASLNTEHSYYVSPYPTRRRAEALAPTEIQKILAGQKIDLVGDALVADLKGRNIKLPGG